MIRECMSNGGRIGSDLPVRKLYCLKTAGVPRHHASESGVQAFLDNFGVTWFHICTVRGVLIEVLNEGLMVEVHCQVSQLHESLWCPRILLVVRQNVMK